MSTCRTSVALGFTFQAQCRFHFVVMQALESANITGHNRWLGKPSSVCRIQVDQSDLLPLAWPAHGFWLVREVRWATCDSTRLAAMHCCVEVNSWVGRRAKNMSPTKASKAVFAVVHCLQVALASSLGSSAVFVEQHGSVTSCFRHNLIPFIVPASISVREADRYLWKKVRLTKNTSCWSLERWMSKISQLKSHRSGWIRAGLDNLTLFLFLPLLVWIIRLIQAQIGSKFAFQQEIQEIFDSIISNSLFFVFFFFQMCACVIRSWVPPGGGNPWTVSAPRNCATRTASAAHVTGSCASASLAETRSAAPCWPPRSARGRWRCCRTRRCTTAAAREAWRKSCSVCRTTGASTWVWLRVSRRQHTAVLRAN